jgi:TonB family protein
MPEPMQTATKRVLVPLEEGLLELPPHSRLPRLDLGVDWASPWEEFRASVKAFFTGPRAPKDEETTNPHLRVEWVRGKFAGRAFAASALWHVAAVLIIILPIWGFLANATPNLAPVRIEVAYFDPAQDLPQIHLPGPAKKPSPPGDPAKPLAKRGADAFHPRQTILSNPVKVTHPRQTLIQPDAPPAPPKIVPQLPNIVEWAATTPAPKIKQPKIMPTNSAPKMQRRAVQDVAAPDIGMREKNPGPLNIAAAPVVNHQPKMPVVPMSAAAAQPRERHADQGADLELGQVAAPGDASLHRVIALSATPGPPAPEVNVPQGNLAARIAISPEGGSSAVPGGAENGGSGNGGSGGNSSSMGGTGGANGSAAGAGGGGGAGSLGAGVSISGGSDPNSMAGGGTHPGGGGIRAGGKLNLNPKAPLSASADPAPSTRRGPADVSKFDPSLPPEKILSGKEVFTLHVNMPNLTSVTGSWLIHCAQLDEGELPGNRPKGVLSGPVPLEKVDPKYPPELIKQHVDGEVILYAIIRSDGKIDSIQMVRGIEPQLNRNAMDALSRWKFRPGTRDGKPIDIEAVIYIPFYFRVSPDY